MKLCYIANANSIHSRRWVLPFVERGHRVSLLSYTRVTDPWPAPVELVDLTQLTNLRKVRFLHWGWWVGRYLRRTRPDLLHALQLTGAGWLGAMVNYHPFVVSSWGSDLLLEPKKSRLRCLLVKQVLRQCDRLTVPTEILYDTALSLAGTRLQVHLIPWGIETSVFQPAPDDRVATRGQLGLDVSSRVIFCPRAISNLYNIDLVLEAVKACAAQIGDVRLILLRYSVDRDYQMEIERRIVVENLGKMVLWLPPQKTSSGMARLYRMSDVVISIPSSEGYGSTVYEALACSCPTIISDLPVFATELGDGIHVVKVPVGDAAQTSQALVTLLTEPKLRHGLRENGLSLARQKDVWKRIEETEALYRELVEGSL
jgi:glycosyltransferase involved in cell wall biosynthesis